MTQQAKPEHNRGDTFDYSGPLALTIGGVPQVNFTGWTGTSEIRTPYGQLIEELEFIWLDQETGIIRVRKQLTNDWPLGPAEFSISLTNPAGDVVSTRTAEFIIV